MAAALPCRTCLQRFTQRLSVASAQPSQQVLSSSLTQQKTLRPATKRRYASTAPPAPPPRPPKGSVDQRLNEAAALAGRRIKQEQVTLNDKQPAIAATEILFKECAAQADYYVPQAFRGEAAPRLETGEEIGEGSGWWYEGLGLIPTYRNWSQVTMLHVWLLTVRIRYFPPEFTQLYLQKMMDHMFWEFEHRMTVFHKVTQRGIRQKYLKDLNASWRGLQGAYDEGLIRGDAVLGAAVWRNLFAGNENVDWKNVALVVGFMRRGLRALDRAQDKTLVGGLIKFGSPMSEKPIVEEESEWMNEPFTKEDEEELVLDPNKAD